MTETATPETSFPASPACRNKREQSERHKYNINVRRTYLCNYYAVYVTEQKTETRHTIKVGVRKNLQPRYVPVGQTACAGCLGHTVSQQTTRADALIILGAVEAQVRPAVSPLLSDVRPILDHLQSVCLLLRVGHENLVRVAGGDILAFTPNVVT